MHGRGRDNLAETDGEMQILIDMVTAGMNEDNKDRKVQLASLRMQNIFNYSLQLIFPSTPPEAAWHLKDVL